MCRSRRWTSVFGRHNADDFSPFRRLAFPLAFQRFYEFPFTLAQILDIENLNQDVGGEFLGGDFGVCGGWGEGGRGGEQDGGEGDVGGEEPDLGCCCYALEGGGFLEAGGEDGMQEGGVWGWETEGGEGVG